MLCFMAVIYVNYGRTVREMGQIYLRGLMDRILRVVYFPIYFKWIFLLIWEKYGRNLRKKQNTAVPYTV